MRNRLQGSWVEDDLHHRILLLMSHADRRIGNLLDPDVTDPLPSERFNASGATQASIPDNTRSVSERAAKVSVRDPPGCGSSWPCPGSRRSFVSSALTRLA
jgi:hypothetical protein